MASIDILGKLVPVEFEVGTGADVVMDRDQIIADAEKMARIIKEKGPWRDEYAEAFRAMNRIVFFEGKVMVNGYEMDRPCCDQDDAVFYWESSEFNTNRDADVHANTYFHDCWHVIQYRADGYPTRPGEDAEREIDAISHQVKVAIQLGCSEAEVDHLTRFASNPQAVRDRLNEGVQFLEEPKPGLAPHKPGLFAR